MKGTASGKFKDFSSSAADLVLATAGERTDEDENTRAAWHKFLAVSAIVMLWYLTSRLILVPSFDGVSWLPEALRLIEIAMYLFWFISLAIVGKRHYRGLLLPGKSLRVATLLFFAFATTLIFSRVYYSIYAYDATLFSKTEYAAAPTAKFGLNGTQDLEASAEFFAFSGCTLLNCGFSGMQSNSLLVEGIRLTETAVGYVFLTVLVATFVQNKIAATVMVAPARPDSASAGDSV